MSKKAAFVLIGLFLFVQVSAESLKADTSFALKEGSVTLKSVGPLAFGPEGILFVSDPQAASIYAIDTQDGKPTDAPDSVKMPKIDTKIAALLGISKDQLLIHDMAVNPISRHTYLSVSRGTGNDAAHLILKLGHDGTISPLSLEKVRYDVVNLPNAPAADAVDRRNQRLRLESITDMSFENGKLFVAGLSNEEFASKLHAFDFPFNGIAKGAGIEIFHTSHGRYETRSPVRTFTHYQIGDEAELLAAYTCTPLVVIPVEKLVSQPKITGTTVAELGNRNRPLDMFVYNKNGKDFILMANSSRGMMKISTEDIAKAGMEGMTEQVRESAGLSYETLQGLDEVYQLDRYDGKNALILFKTATGDHHIETLELP